MRIGSWKGIAVALVVGAGVLVSAAQAYAADVLVFAAASLKNALDDADAAYLKQTKTKITASYAASGPLAKQIENGAPADIFISADLNWMKYVSDKHLIQEQSQVNLLGNKLVLVAAKDSTLKVDITPGFDLAGLIGNSRLSIGDPKSVPAGTYAQAALTKLGVWDKVQGKLAPAADVRGALALVSKGESPLGIVYQTDVNSDPGVKTIAEFPQDSYPPIIYPVALLASSKNPDAVKFLNWLTSKPAAVYFEKQGFTVLR